uniref:ZAD domain-containing protein n=1 Tax=Stomoxys calcitrans TaxID=35570 RepID=A0A1I8Q5T4_STOCA
MSTILTRQTTMEIMCRLCASLKPRLINTTAISHDITHKLLQWCKINLEKDSPLPKSICQECMEELNRSYKFLTKVQEAQRSLQAFFGVETTSDADTNDNENFSFAITDVSSLSKANSHAAREYILPETVTSVKREQQSCDEEFAEAVLENYALAEEDNENMDTTEEASPPSKRSKRDANTSSTSEGHNTCICSKMLSKLDEMKAQIKTLIDASNENTKFLRTQLSQAGMEIRKNFPIQSWEELVEMNEKINKENKIDYVKTMHSLIHPVGVVKNLKYIISTKVTIHFNVDGVHGKESLKRLSNFYTALLEAIPNPPQNTEPAEEQLRKAIYLQKKRELKAIGAAKNKKGDTTTSNKTREYNFQKKRCEPSNVNTKILRNKSRLEGVEIRTNFPIQTEEELLEVNEKINQENKIDYVKTMHSLIHPVGVVKNLKHIISTKVTVHYNVDGSHGKKSLKRLSNFYNALLEAIPNPPQNTDPAEDQLRKAIYLQKKRELKAMGAAKNKKEDTTTSNITCEYNEAHPIEEVFLPSIK